MHRGNLVRVCYGRRLARSQNLADGFVMLLHGRPCKMISPHFEKMAGTTEGVEFIKVDVDDAPVSWTNESQGRAECLIRFLMIPPQQEISEFAGIRAMPTFIAYSKGKDIKTVTGAKPAELKVRGFHRYLFPLDLD